MQYIATFHTHFAAQCFARLIKKENIPGRMMPVPRSLSVSCGTCVSFDTDGDISSLSVDDIEAVYRVEGNKYELCFKAE